jgi:UDP-N-acetyl-D-galactosamine dehydrogenase
MPVTLESGNKKSYQGQLIERLGLMSEKIAVIGLGYVGLPVALALAGKFDTVWGFDIRQSRIDALKKGEDSTGEAETGILKQTKLRFTANPADIKDCTVFIVAVPTPIDANKQPDLKPVLSASRTVGKVLKKGDVVVFESTVYPGVTEDVCGPALAEISGLKQGVDFKLGYSPERINPGDKLHTLEKITKIVSGEDAETLDRVAAVYDEIIEAGLHRAASIKVAEAAKVIENIQRDVNIALMNELALIFDRLGLRTVEVLRAAGTKWNFLPFTPGLVGGHCIGVDPYYLTARAEQAGYHPEVILSGRRINDNMGATIAQKAVKLLITSGTGVKQAKIGILGLTFKENVPDLRNSKVPDIINELKSFGITPLVHDAVADPDEAHEEYGLTPASLDAFKDLDVLILAVSHRAYLDGKADGLKRYLRKGGIFIDVKSAFEPEDFKDYTYWSL